MSVLGSAVMAFIEGELIDLGYLTDKERSQLQRVIKNDIALKKESFW